MFCLRAVECMRACTYIVWTASGIKCSCDRATAAAQVKRPRKSSIAAKHRKQSTSLFVFARAFLNFACLKLHRVPEAETRTVKLLRRRAQLLSITFWNAAHT